MKADTSDYSREASSAACPCPQLLSAVANLGFEMNIEILAFLRIIFWSKIEVNAVL